jgi:MFS family permease
VQELRAESISLFQAVKYRAFWLCFFIWLTQAFGTFMIMTHLVPYATDSGLSAGQAASMISVLGAASLLGRLTMGRLADVQSKKLIGAAGIVLMCLAMFWLIWATNLWMLVVFGVVFGLGMGGSGPAMIAIVADLFGVRYLGAILGAMDTSFGIGSALGPAAAGFIFDLRHSYTLAFLIAAIFIVVSLVLFLALRISPHSSSNPHSKHKTHDS